MTERKKTIIAIDGGKGGVGKSHFALMVADRLRAAGANPGCIDQDKTNPDFARITQDCLPTLISPCGDVEGWADMLIAAEQILDTTDHIVISTAAGTTGIENPAVAELVEQWMDENDVELKTIFILGKSADSPNLAARSLSEGLASRSASKIAVKNGFFGDESRGFDRWHQSEERKMWLEGGGVECYMPDLFWQVVDAITENGVMPADLIPHLNSVHRIQLTSWLNKLGENVLPPLGLPTTAAHTAPPKDKSARDADAEEAA